MTVRLWMTVAPLFLVGTLCAPLTTVAAPVASSASPKALSLTLSDVRHVYGSAFRPFLSNNYKASRYHTCGADYTAGYLAMFGNFQKASKAGGIVSVESTVFAYGSSKSAVCAASNNTVVRENAMHHAGTTVHSSSLSGIGDNARIFTMKTAKVRAYSVMIWLSRGAHTAMVTVSAIGNASPRAGAIELAKLVDARLGVAG